MPLNAGLPAGVNGRLDYPARRMGALLGRRPADAAGDGFSARPVGGYYDRGGCFGGAWQYEPLGHDRGRNRRRHAW